MSGRRRNGAALPPEYEPVVLEEIATGGIPAVHRRFAQMTNGARALALPALRFANERLGGLWDDDELAELADLGYSHREAVEKQARRLRADREARALVSSDGIVLPDLPSGTLADDLAKPPPTREFTVDDLLPKGGNAVLVGARKDGKTTVVANLVRALADADFFLGVFKTHLDGRVAYVNYELDEDMARRWLADLDIEHPERIAAPLHLRGRRLPFWMASVRDPFAAWLRDNDIQALVLDPGSRAWRGLVEEENSNSQMAAFTQAVDELKVASGVQEVVIPVHRGRAQQTEGSEHSRGATALEDWADAIWVLTKDSRGTRFFRATGRDVDEEARELAYEPATRSVYITGRTRTEQRRDDWTDAVLVALAGMEERGDYPAKTGELRAVMHLAKDHRDEALAAALADGYVVRTPGANNAKLYAFTPKGKRRAEHAGEDA